MGVSGAWAQKARTDYTGATRWGTGYDPIHETRDNGLGRVLGAKATLYPLGEPSDVVSATLEGRDIDFVVEDYVDATIPGEFFRYQDERPRWDETPGQFRDDIYSPAMGEWLPYGVYNDADQYPGFPLPGPTGGMSVELDVSHGVEVERQHMIAVPTQPVHGGWLSKTRGALAVAESQEVGDPTAQWAVGTAAVQGQGLKELTNDRAVGRGTDSPRAGILSRVAGMAEKAYARSFGMGGGAGTPDMFPFQQTPGYKRPFITRAVGLAPPEDHFMNTLEQRTPLQRAVPADPYQGDPEVGAGQDQSYADWGY